MRILITGGFGFIGSHAVKHFLSEGHEIAVLDSITYAANSDGLDKMLGYPNGWPFKMYQVDLRDQEAVESVIINFKPEAVLHFAAESHVCNSIKGPRLFYETNVMGTFNLLNAIKHNIPNCRVVHVSTDEVFGDLGFNQPEVRFHEQTPIDPRSPYSSSKAASDHIALAYAHTYGMGIMVTNCSNNYGTNQHEEKLIPGTIRRILNGEPIKIYGEGTQIRDWLHVSDHVRAIEVVLHKGVSGERYCIGGDTELTNKAVVEKIAQCMGKKDYPIEYTNDRPTDDLRYAIDNSKVRELGWCPMVMFEVGLMGVIEDISNVRS